MYMNRHIAKDLVPPVRVIDTAEALSDIHDPGTAGVIWEREPLADFQDWIDTLPPELLPSTRMMLQPKHIHSALETVCQSAGVPAGPMQDMLIDDIAALGQIFGQVMQTPYLRLRLEAVKGNACRRFHIDAIRARLICTYRGTGTQYGIGRDGTAPEHHFEVPTGSPFLLRGSLWPVSPKSGMLHRSPPIEGTGETRLLLVLDPILDPLAEEEL